MSSAPVIVPSRVHWQAWRDYGLNGSGVGAVVLALHRHSSRAGLSWPGVETIAAVCRVGARQAQRHLKRLEVAGWIRRELAGPGSALFLLSIPEALADDLGLAPLSREELLADLGSRPRPTPERIRSAAIRAALSFHGEPDPLKRGDTSDAKGVTYTTKRGDTSDRDGVTHPTSAIILDELKEEEEDEEEGSSLFLSSHSQESKTKTGGARARLREARERIPERSRGIVRSLLGSAQWSRKQRDLVERILSELPESRPRELTSADRIAIAAQIAERLPALGVKRLAWVNPFGVEEALPVTSWKLRERLLGPIGESGGSLVDPDEIAAQIAAMELGRIRILKGRARA